MQPQELSAIAELHNLIQNWREKYVPEWVSRSQEFKRFYQSVKLQQQTIALVFDHSIVPRKTIEEKLADAVFYVDEFGSTYKINFHCVEERWFDVSNVEEDNDTFIVGYDNIPANAYFLGTHKL